MMHECHKMRLRFSLFFIVLLHFLSLASCLNAGNISPLQYGLNDAQNSLERYNVLLRTHQAAVETNSGVTYTGIERIEIEIPKSAKGIPLTSFTDFAGVEIVVKNTQKKMALFVLSQELKDTFVTKEQLRRGRFKRNKDLSSGLILLVLEDETPWVAKRKGYNYGAVRKDVVLIDRGVAMNETIAPYTNTTSKPKCSFCAVSREQTVIKDLVFIRSEDSSQITGFLTVRNQNNVLIKRVSTKTPSQTSLFGDTIIRVENSTNVTMEDVTINGTYSTSKSFGYAIGMNNVWNSHFIRLIAHGEWGVFGNSNINYAVVENSDLNRFDIHCYGRDVYCYRTTFRDKFNQFSSLFGDLIYEDCQFIDFVPVLFEASYDAYTPFSLIIKGCVIKCRDKAPYLINAGHLNTKKTTVREELAELSWPNIILKDVVVQLPLGENAWTLFNVIGASTIPVDSIDQISMQSVKVISSSHKAPVVKFSNHQTKTVNPIRVSVSDSSFESILF